MSEKEKTIDKKKEEKLEKLNEQIKQRLAIQEAKKKLYGPVGSSKENPLYIYSVNNKGITKKGLIFSNLITKLISIMILISLLAIIWFVFIKDSVLYDILSKAGTVFVTIITYLYDSLDWIVNAGSNIADWIEELFSDIFSSMGKSVGGIFSR